VDFRIANSIWYRESFPFHRQFLDESRQYFDAEVRGMNFGDPATLDVINGWVDERTNGKIDEIIDAISPDDVMFLINAIYFKGTWQYQFKPEETRNETFHTPKGPVAVPLMRQTAPLRYLETPEFQGVDLLYNTGAFAMTVLLPKPGRDVNALVAWLDAARWQEITERFAEEEQVSLILPRFTLTFEDMLNPSLRSLGMALAFSPGFADFTRMSPQGRDLYISFVKQKTFVDVNEEGTEAAAATAVGIRVTSVGPSHPVVVVDRPFLFAIRERASGAVLFIGKVTAPHAP
jgi:serine protease inhibitor